MLTPPNRHHWRQMIDAAFIRAPDDRVAIVYLSQTEDGAIETKTIRRGDLRWQVAAYAGALSDRGIKGGDLVVIAHTQNLESIYLFWAALWIGAIPSMFPTLTEKLDPDRYRAGMAELVRLSDVRAVLTSDDFAETLAQVVACPVYGSRALGAMRAITIPPLRDVAPDSIAFLQHSSGTTGLQKGVALSHRAVLDQIAAYSAALHLAHDDVVVSWLPLYHDMGLIAGFLLPLIQGIPLVLMSPFQWIRDPKLLLDAIQRHRATLCWLPNFAYNFLATRIRDPYLEGLDLSSVRAFINCSEPVYAESHRLFLERFAPYGVRADTLTTCYAMAENTFAVTQAGIDSPVRIDVIDRRALMEDRRALPTPNGLVLVSCGAPIPNCAVRVVDEGRRSLPEREVGEIALRSDSMLSGYYRRPELTEAALSDGWYFTGDMGYLADGELYITGRKKDLIIVGGKNVYPQDLENLLNDIPGVYAGRTVAFGVPNAQLGTEDIAIVVEVAEASILDDVNAKAAIQRDIRARIAQNTDVTARHVQLVPPRWLIKTSSGKVARTANREKFLHEFLNPSVEGNVQ